MVQVFIGVFAAASLVYKRILEPPNSRRPVSIWLMDVSKQGVSSVVIHFSNILLAIIYASMDIFQSGEQEGDECAFYFIGFVMDTIVGVFIIWLLLKAVRSIALYFGVHALIDQGYYGNPPRASWYFSQLVCFLVVCLTAKFLIGIVMLEFASEVSSVGNFLFEPIEANPELELVIVMIVCPTFLSIIQVTFVRRCFIDFDTDVTVYVHCSIGFKTTF